MWPFQMTAICSAARYPSCACPCSGWWNEGGACTACRGEPEGGGRGRESGLDGKGRTYLIVSEVLVIGALLQLLHEGALVRRRHVELQLDAVQKVQQLRGLELALDVHRAERVGLARDLLSAGGRGCGGLAAPTRRVVAVVRRGRRGGCGGVRAAGGGRVLPGAGRRRGLLCRGRVSGRLVLRGRLAGEGGRGRQQQDREQQPSRPHFSSLRRLTASARFGSSLPTDCVYWVR